MQSDISIHLNPGAARHPEDLFSNDHRTAFLTHNDFMDPAGFDIDPHASFVRLLFNVLLMRKPYRYLTLSNQMSGPSFVRMWRIMSIATGQVRHMHGNVLENCSRALCV